MGTFAANLKREVSNTKLTDLEIPPLPCTRMKFGNEMALRRIVGRGSALGVSTPGTFARRHGTPGVEKFDQQNVVAGVVAGVVHELQPQHSETFGWK